MRYKVAIRFAIDGDLRFISHHDTMRLFERALTRAQLPVKYSEGFNPRPRLSLPLPRAVGVASEADVLVVEMTELIDPQVVRERLSAQIPADLTLGQAWVVPGGRTLQVERVEYAVAAAHEGLQDAIERLLAAETWTVQRGAGPKGRAKAVDVRGFISEIRLEEGTLRWTARVTNGGTIRPAEILNALDLPAEELHHKVRRTSVQWAHGGESPAGEPTLAAD